MPLSMSPFLQYEWCLSEIFLNKVIFLYLINLWAFIMLLVRPNCLGEIVIVASSVFESLLEILYAALYDVIWL